MTRYCRLLVSLILLSSVAVAVGLRRGTAPRPAEHKLESNESERSYFFTAFHKTGTALINHICDHIRMTVEGDKCSRCTHLLNTTGEGTWCTHRWSDGLTVKSWPEFYNSSSRYFAGTGLQEVRKKVANYRAVMVIRDPLTTFASAFIYDQKGEDHMGLGRKELEGLSLKDALRAKAADTGVHRLMEGMLDTHKMAQRDPNILEVHFEDFKSDYAGTAGKIFSFMRGGDREDLRLQFLQRAQVDDQARWPARRMNQTHVSDPAEERRVVEAVRELCASGSEEILEVLAFRGQLGYETECYPHTADLMAHPADS